MFDFVVVLQKATFKKDTIFNGSKWTCIKKQAEGSPLQPPIPFPSNLLQFASAEPKAASSYWGLLEAAFEAENKTKNEKRLSFAWRVRSYKEFLAATIY